MESDMSVEAIKCVLLADRHHGLSEGIRGLLESEFDAVVMVANETSLIESAMRLQPSLVVADLALAQGESFGWLRRLLLRCPEARVIVLSSHDEPAIMQAALDAGAAGFVRKHEIATRLMPVVESVLAGGPASPGPGETPPLN
jgi:two-component system capsular synthesis response regulator RcsB